MTDTFTPAELATIRADLTASEREAAINEAARKVADAAVRMQTNDILRCAEPGAWQAFEEAVREYRALAESPERVEYVSHRLPGENAGGHDRHCSRCGEAVPGGKP